MTLPILIQLLYYYIQNTKQFYNPQFQNNINQFSNQQPMMNNLFPNNQNPQNNNINNLLGDYDSDTDDQSQNSQLDSQVDSHSISVINNIKDTENKSLNSTINHSTEIKSDKMYSTSKTQIQSSKTNKNMKNTKESLSSIVNKIKDMSKTNSLKIESSSSTASSVTKSKSLKTSVKDSIHRNSAIKLESLSSNTTYSKTDEIHSCSEIKGFQTIVSNVEGKNIKFVSELEISEDKFQLYDSASHKSTYLSLKFQEIDFSSLDKLVSINNLSCIELSNLQGEVIYICDDDGNRIIDLTDNIKMFMTSCKGVVHKINTPTLDDQIAKEKTELAALVGRLQSAVSTKNSSIKNDQIKNRKNMLSYQDKQIQMLKQRMMLEEVIQARENEEYRQIEKLISELELEKEKEKISRIIKEVEKDKEKQKNMIKEEQQVMSSQIETRMTETQQQIMTLALEGEHKGDQKKCSSFTGEETEVRVLVLNKDQTSINSFCSQCCLKENGRLLHLDSFKCRTACKENIKIIYKKLVDRLLETALNKQQ